MVKSFQIRILLVSFLKEIKIENVLFALKGYKKENVRTKVKPFARTFLIYLSNLPIANR
jgi:hypothetical protein